MMTWKIYLLDDDQGRHDLLPKLLEALTKWSEQNSGNHQFEHGFSDGTPTLSASAINNVLEDVEGIWLVDLHIPQGDGVGPASEIWQSAGASETDLALAVIKKLEQKKRNFLVISSGNLPEAQAIKMSRTISASKASFAGPEDVDGMLRSVLELVDTKMIYQRAFENATRSLWKKEYHKSINDGIGMAMFNRDHPIHDLSSWSKVYKTRPAEEFIAIQDILKTLMLAWSLNDEVLNPYRTEISYENWNFVAAKSLNAEAIHRAFLFALSDSHTLIQTLPSGSLRIRNRNIRESRAPAAVHGLQTLIEGGGDEGFALRDIQEWKMNDRSGIQLNLLARFGGLQGYERFEKVLKGNWEPPKQPNTSRLSRSLKDVRDAFFTDTSEVTRLENHLQIALRIEEVKLT